jgi:hypothetical protein
MLGPWGWYVSVCVCVCVFVCVCVKGHGQGLLKGAERFRTQRASAVSFRS